MQAYSDPTQFEIDVDVAPLLGMRASDIVVSDRWYKLLRGAPERPAMLQSKIERAFHNELLHAQWKLAAMRPHERRRALRAPLLSRVNVEVGEPLITCDISLSGLKASGRPRNDVFDVEFKLPNLAFPVDARVEVVSFKDNNVIPLAGLRFVDIDTAYLEHINHYIAERRQRQLAA